MYAQSVYRSSAGRLRRRMRHATMDSTPMYPLGASIAKTVLKVPLHFLSHLTARAARVIRAGLQPTTAWPR